MATQTSAAEREAIVPPSPYHPARAVGVSFSMARPAFFTESDTPSAFLERCLHTITEREPAVRAWVVLDVIGAREAARLATLRYRAGRPLSRIDGMPIGVKDLIATKTMATEMGCQAFTGYRPDRDAPVVRALREAGAIILGKTVTAELGMNEPGPTVNPFNYSHTPGGSSSGSAAAVGAGMVPAALGTQVGGSIIRPSSFCATFGFKPTLGALNRESTLGLSQEVYGVHAGCLEDMWKVAAEIASRTGGDPGYPGLYGEVEPPAPLKPQRVVVLETPAWRRLDTASSMAFERVVKQLAAHDIEVIRWGDDQRVEAFEACMADAKEITDQINSYELWRSVRHLFERQSDKFSERLRVRFEKAKNISHDEYRDLLKRRAAARAQHAQLAAVADVVLTLSSRGPAPRWSGDTPGQPLNPTPTGDSSFNVPASLLGAPAISIPIMAVDGLPLGVQIIGQQHEDAKLCAIAGWLKETISPVAVQS